MKNVKATTLVEIMVYFAIFGIFMAAAMSFALQIGTISDISSRLYEVQTQTSFLEEKMKTTIQSADSVNVAGSTFDSDAGVLSLVMTDAGVSPTVFSLLNGDILMKEGAADASALHSSTIEVTSLRFHRISYAQTPDQIQVDAVIATPSDLANSDKTFSLHFTVSLRQ
ncbi:MAG: prepilin-type N-terminal cleavage/methylation domain-containing protein [Patescibacteria group bacterium]